MKKPGPKLKEGVPENVATMLRIDRLLYAKISEISVTENLKIADVMNEAMELRIKQFKKEAPKRHKVHLARAESKRQAKWDNATIIEGHRYTIELCAECLERKLVQWGDSVCDKCKNSTATPPPSR